MGMINHPSGKVNGYSFIDLGLSVNWAMYNVGKPLPFGDYFAWGEITPTSVHSDKDCTTMGKEIGEIQGDPKYDAATANWGSPWRMPTRKEMDELINKCDWKWMSVGVFNGYEITGPSGNHLYLPAAGYLYGIGETPFEEGKRGEYWSSSPCGNLFRSAYSLLFFGNGGLSTQYNSRCEGRSIRPVIDIDEM